MNAKIQFLLSAAGLAALASIAPAAAAQVEAPAVPSTLEAPEGNRPYLIAHAYGTQNQVCLPRPNGVGLGWAFYGPIATLYNDQDEQVLTHYLSPNPDEAGTGRATWQHSRDASTVWAKTYVDPVTVDPTAIPWLLLQVVGSEGGRDGGDKLSVTTFIQRVNTVGGVAPATDCAPLGAKLFVPYETDYVFYRAD
jgi:hypothetical protein